MITLKDPDAKDKPTALKEDAEIYQKREPKTERQKFQEMKTGKDKLKYLRTYYLKPAIFCTLGLGLAIYFLYTVLSPKDQCRLKVAFVDYPFSKLVTDNMAADFMEASNIVLQEHEIIDFDGTTYHVSDSLDFNSAAILTTHIMAKEIDVFVAPESTFQNYAFSGIMGSLTELLPSDLYSALSDRFFISHVKEAGEIEGKASKEEYVFGIYLDETPFWEVYGIYANPSERPVIGIVTNGQNKDMAVDFLRYLLCTPSK